MQEVAELVLRVQTIEAQRNVLDLQERVRASRAAFEQQDAAIEHSAAVAREQTTAVAASHRDAQRVVEQAKAAESRAVQQAAAVEVRAAQQVVAAHASVGTALHSAGAEMVSTRELAQSLFFSFNGLAGSAFGVNQSVSDLFARLGQAAVGTTWTAGILVGITIIGHAWRELGGEATAAAEEAKKAAEQMQKSIDDLVNAGNFADLTRQYRETQQGTRAGNYADGESALRAQRAALQTQLDQIAATARRFGDASGDPLAGVGDPLAKKLQGQIDAIDKHIGEVATRRDALYAALTDPRNSQQYVDGIARPIVTAAEGASAAHRDLTHAVTETRRAADAAWHEQVVDAERYLNMLKAVTAEEQAWARQRQQTATILDRVIDADLASQRRAQGDAQTSGLRAAIAASASTDAAGALFSPAQMAAIGQAAQDALSRREFHDAIAQATAQAIAQGVLRGLEDGVLGGRAFWESFARLGESVLEASLQRTFAKLANSKAAQAVGVGADAAFVGYGIGYATGGKSEATGALAGAGAGALAGALAGSVVPVVGTAIGAAVGAAVGAIGGLVGAHNKAKDAAEQLAKAQVEAANAMHNAEATRVGLGGALTVDLTGRELAASGQDAAAARFRLIQQQGDELAKYQNSGVDPTIIERLRQIQALELARADALERQATAMQHADFATSVQQLGRDVAGGDSRAAYFDDLLAKSNAQAAAWAKLYDQGIIGFGELSNALGLLNLRTQQQIDAFDRQAEAERLAAVRREEDARQELSLRILTASGQTDLAETLRRQIEHERELRDVTDAATRAGIQYAQSLEDQAAAAQKAAAAAQAVAQAEQQRVSTGLSGIGSVGSSLGWSPDQVFQAYSGLLTSNDTLRNAVGRYLGPGQSFGAPTTIADAIQHWIQDNLSPQIFGTYTGGGLQDTLGLYNQLQPILAAAQALTSSSASMTGDATALPPGASGIKAIAAGSAFNGATASDINEANGLMRSQLEQLREQTSLLRQIARNGASGLSARSLATVDQYLGEQSISNTITLPVS